MAVVDLVMSLERIHRLLLVKQTGCHVQDRLNVVVLHVALALARGIHHRNLKFNRSD